MANHLTKQSSEAEIKAYFTEVLKLAQSEEQFPVNLDDVWPLVYNRKQEAVRSLQNNNLFLQGIDYQVLRKNAQKSDGLSANDGETLNMGRPTEYYFLTVPCLEFFIARKVRPVFEVYRQVFHKVAAAQTEANEQPLLTVDTFIDQFGDPIIDARSYHYVLSEWKRDKFCDWMARRIQSLNMKEGSDYAEYEVAKPNDDTQDARRRDYAFSLRSFTRLVKHDAHHVRNAKAMKYTYNILSTLRECERRHQNGQLDMASYIASVRNATYKLPSARIIRKTMEQQHAELADRQQPDLPFDGYKPLPEEEMQMIGSKMNINQMPGQHATLRPLAAYNAHVSCRFNRIIQLSSSNPEMHNIYADYRSAYTTLRRTVANLTFMEAVYDLEGEHPLMAECADEASDGKEARA